MTVREPFEEKYTILEKIGQGGMGAVYKVRHRLLDELRVIKVIRSPLEPTPEAEERFLREARTACRLRHPNVALLHDFALGADGRAYIVLEHIDGSTLRELLQGLGPPPLSLALEIARQTALALQFLHRQRIVHRDISPGNLMLTRDFQGGPLVKLIDLGLAKSLEGGTDGLTKGVFLGKVKYAAPEQFDEGPVDERSDLYSFGVVFYELLTGRSPIAGHDPKTWMAAHLFRPPLDFAESDPEGRVPEDLRDLVLRLLAKDPAARFASAGELLQGLAGVQARFPLRGDELDGVFAPPPSAEAAAMAPEPDPGVAPEPDPDVVPEEEPAADAAPVPVALTLDPDSISLPLHRFGRKVEEESSVSIPLALGRRPAAPVHEEPSWDAPVQRRDERAYLYEPMEEPDDPDMTVATLPPPARRSGKALPLLVGVFSLAIICALIALYSVTSEFQLGHSEPGDEIVETELVDPAEEAQPDPVAGSTNEETEEIAAAPDSPRADEPLIEELGAVEPEPEIESEVASEEVDSVPRPAPAPPVQPVQVAEEPRPAPATPRPRVEPPAPARREEPVRSARREETARPEPAPAERVAQAAPPQRRQPPAVREGGVRPGPGVVPPIPLDMPRFSYPAAARGQGIDLDVRVDLLVDERGKVIEAVVREGDAEGLGFNEAALAAARRTSFQPATRGDVPVKMWTEMIFQFSETGSGR